MILENNYLNISGQLLKPLADHDDNQLSQIVHANVESV